MKVILFDLDGTLLDTLEDLKNAVNLGLIGYNFPPRTKEFVRLAIGNGTTKLMERCCPEGTDEDTIQKALKLFKESYSKHYFENTKPYDGIIEFVKELKRNYLLGVVSNKDDKFVKSLIDELMPNLFDIVQGSYVDKPRKPDPYLIQKVVQENKLNINDILYIGDSNVDAELGKNCNMKTLLVDYGYRTHEELLVQCPNSDISSTYDELKEKIEAYFN